MSLAALQREAERRAAENDTTVEYELEKLRRKPEGNVEAAGPDAPAAVTVTEDLEGSSEHTDSGENDDDETNAADDTVTD